MYETITSPISYGGISLKNRVIFAPTSMGLRGEDLTARLGRIAAGGCAMIVIGDVPVLPQRFVPSLYTEKGRAFYRALADAVHREGCLLCAQLHQSDANVKAMGKYLPGVLTGRISKEDLRPLLNRQVGPYITGLSQRKIREITEGFRRQAGMRRLPFSGGCAPLFPPNPVVLWKVPPKTCTNWQEFFSEGKQESSF